MAHTKRGAKSPGFEYWTNRPGNKGGSTPGKISKEITHRKERQIKKKILRDVQENY